MLMGKVSKNSTGQKRFDGFVPGQDPAQAVVPDERTDGFVKEGFHDAEFQAHAQQTAGNQRPVLGKGLRPDRGHYQLLQCAVKTVAGPAHGLEILHRETGLETVQVDRRVRGWCR